MFDPIQTALHNSRRDPSGWLAFSALPDAPVLPEREGSVRTWRPAVARVMRQMAARLDRPVVADAATC